MQEAELERTFLAANIPPGMLAARHRDILDLYVPVTAEHPVVRVRSSDGKYEITKKVTDPNDPSIRTEETIPLSEEEYAALAAVPNKRLNKTRYYFEHAGVEYQIGVYHDNLEGLVIIDVEFDSIEEMRAFVPPDFVLAEVTQLKLLRGGILAGKSYADIEQTLAPLGYKPLTA